ncbi:unnamed protein product [Effrenium voratum]|uniref:Methionine aminopeptidase n=1 Tax=Effrenium voratum TaxID=2562239 RepID=A0AA36MRX0_9DINO|nr:unnamed protein product [Effrenium voratum]
MSLAPPLWTGLRPCIGQVERRPKAGPSEAPPALQKRRWAAGAVALTATSTRRRQPVLRGDLSPARKVPQEIPRPFYLGPDQPRSPADGLPLHEFYSGRDPTPEERVQLDIKTPEQVEGMRAACRLARATLETAGKSVAPGVTTDEIDRIAHEFIVDHGAYPSPLGYCGFPKAVCTSVNEIIGHGIPDSRPLSEGDFLNIDVTVYLNGYHGDTSCMFFAGPPSKRAAKLCKATRKAMLAGIEVCGPGVDFREVGRAITASAEEDGCTVHPSLVGHGIGSYFHGRPEILPYVNDDDWGVMQPNMTFTVEPALVDAPDRTCEVDAEDLWTMCTMTKALGAQFEHTILITDHGMEILTGPCIDYTGMAPSPVKALPSAI